MSACSYRWTWRSGEWWMRARGACGRSPEAFITLRHQHRAARASTRCFRYFSHTCAASCTCFFMDRVSVSAVFSTGVLLLHHWHVRERRKAPGVGGQRRLHQRAGWHHPTYPQQQRLVGYVGSQTRGHAVSRQHTGHLFNKVVLFFCHIVSNAVYYLFISREEVNKAYRKLAVLLHPDKCVAPGSEDAFKAVVNARTSLLKNIK